MFIYLLDLCVGASSLGYEENKNSQFIIYFILGVPHIEVLVLNKKFEKVESIVDARQRLHALKLHSSPLKPNRKCIVIWM